MPARTVTSSADTASSSTISAGRWRWRGRSRRAAAGRRRSRGRARPARSGVEPDAFEQAGDAARPLVRPARRWMRSGSSSTPATVARGLKAASGSWNTIWKRGLSWRSASPRARKQVDAVEAERAGEVGLDQPHDDAGERRLAAAGRTDQRQRLAAREVQRDVVERDDGLGRRGGTISTRRRAPAAGAHRAAPAPDAASSSDARVGFARARRSISAVSPISTRPAGAEDGDAVGNAGGQRDVVADEDQRHAARPATSRVDQRHDVGLDDGVERAGRLVGDQQFRSGGDRRGDRDALALAAGKLVRTGRADALGSGRRTRPISSTASVAGPSASRGRDGCAPIRRSARRPA